MRFSACVPSLDSIRKKAVAGAVIPVYREIVADLETPVSTFLKLAGDDPHAYLLESVEGGEHWGRYSLIAWDPYRIFESRDGRCACYVPGTAPVWKDTKDPVSELKRIMASYAPVENAGLPRFWGGAVGYFSYDMVRTIESLPGKPADTLKAPDAVFYLTGKLVIFDHLNHTAKIVRCVHCDNTTKIDALYRQAENEIEGIIRKLRAPLKTRVPKRYEHEPLASNITPEAYRDSVRAAKKHIRSGEIIQAVLSHRFTRKTKADPFDIYRSLRLINPSPYMYFLRMDGFDMAGSSPEILVRKEDSLAETRPIAGTRRRGSNEDEDSRIAEELLADEKERAEHIMLVDLGRNDIGRVSVPATVSVPELMKVEKYSHVMHIVSSVKGTLRPGIDSFELFKACFPAGTVSGAPKVRAMQIIDKLEPEARGTYAGSVGYFSYSGNMDMAITIRTILLAGGVAYAQAGAGIVADSDPESEYRETHNKAAALFEALDAAEEGIEA